MKSLYENVLAERFEQMSPLLQRFHRQIGTVWRGEATVSWSRKRLQRLICRFARMPSEKENVAVEVSLAQRGRNEIWQRNFAGRLMVSRQYAFNDELHEAFGPLSLLLISRVSAGTLRQRSARTYCLGIPVSRILPLTVVAREWSKNGQLHFDVAITFRSWRLIRYTGTLRPASA